jgi:hypothetical protein
MSAVAVADVGEILQAHFKAVGGLDLLSRIKTVERSGVAEMGGILGDMEGTIRRVVVVGKKSYEDMNLSGFREITGWNGTSGWKSSSTDGLLDLLGSDLDNAKSAVFLDPLQEIYEQSGSSAFTQGQDATIYNHECVTLEILDGLLTYYIDPGFPIWKSHLEIRRHRLTL